MDHLDGLFRQAVAAIDAGDAVLLERLLAEHPRLVRDRLESPGEWLRAQIGPALDGFFRHPYLLWFVTEDAVRTGQLFANVAEVARAIIQAASRAGVTDCSSSSIQPFTSRCVRRLDERMAGSSNCSTCSLMRALRRKAVRFRP